MTISGRAARGKVKGSDGLQSYTGTDTSRNLGPGSTRREATHGSEALRTAQAAARCPTEWTCCLQRNTDPAQHTASVAGRPLAIGCSRPRTAPRLLHPGHTGPRPPPQLRRDPRHTGQGFISPRTWLPVYQLKRSKCSFLFTSHLNEQDWKRIQSAYEPGKARPHNEQGHLQWVAASQGSVENHEWLAGDGA